MTMQLKRWTALGLGAGLALGALSACSGAQEPATDNEVEVAALDQDASTPTSASSGEGEGEGGVAITEAATDPIVYISALAITEAHIIAARDAHVLGETEAAAEMFAHPVSEVLFDMEPIFEARGVEDFTGLLSATSVAVIEGEDEAKIAERSDLIIAVLREAAKKAPDDGSSKAKIMGGVTADQIERAADMYRVSLGTDAYEPYLDGYGFYKAAEAAYLPNAEAIRAEDAELADAIEAALSELDLTYPSAVRPDELDADLSSLTVAASRVVLAASN